MLINFKTFIIKLTWTKVAEISLCLDGESLKERWSVIDIRKEHNYTIDIELDSTLGRPPNIASTPVARGGGGSRGLYEPPFEN